ncbi:hypothetical protein GCM10010124_26360 [Pilimelia terevasa]|uniref:Uncharacterized protein n=1 Tax=Pilimelia terevasa TaxID=53372 RepID=A0A8J3BMN4_9ACTN|nr:hypothetical protein [Pilimelia terevasa]GGK32306.1 hypothetical protein GCM10010124_26360 [Pilimelia terevasa]
MGGMSAVDPIVVTGLDRHLSYDGAWIRVEPRWWVRVVHAWRHARAQAKATRGARAVGLKPPRLPKPPTQVTFPVRDVTSVALRPARWWLPGLLAVDAPGHNDPWRRPTWWRRRRRPHAIRFTTGDPDLIYALYLLLREDLGF